MLVLVYCFLTSSRHDDELNAHILCSCLCFVWFISGKVLASLTSRLLIVCLTESEGTDAMTCLSAFISLLFLYILRMYICMIMYMLYDTYVLRMYIYTTARTRKIHHKLDSVFFVSDTGHTGMCWCMYHTMMTPFPDLLFPLCHRVNTRTAAALRMHPLLEHLMVSVAQVETQKTDRHHLRGFFWCIYDYYYYITTAVLLYDTSYYRGIVPKETSVSQSCDEHWRWHFSFFIFPTPSLPIVFAFSLRIRTAAVRPTRYLRRGRRLLFAFHTAAPLLCGV